MTIPNSTKDSMNNLRYFNNIAYGNFKDLDVLVDPDGNKILVTYPTIEKVLGYEPDNARKKLGAKSLEAFADKDLAVANKVLLSARLVLK